MVRYQYPQFMHGDGIPARTQVRQLRVLLAGLMTAALLLVPSCSGSAPRVDAAMVQRAQASDPPADQATLEDARAIYAARCGSCHDLPMPDSKPQAAWPHYLKTMAPKARLNAEQSRLVLEYVLAAHTP